MRSGRWRAIGRDEGSTQIVMLVAMVCAFGLTLLAVQVAQANDMRTRGQTAADAAAIAAVTPLRDEAIKLAQEGIDPNGLGLWEVVPNINITDTAYTQAARDYAVRNGGTLIGKAEPSGMLGDTMKATVQTKDCQLKQESELTEQDRKDLREKRNLCTDAAGNTGIARGHGSGTSIAKLFIPPCEWEFTTIIGPTGQLIQVPDKLRCGYGTKTVVWDKDRPIPRSEIIRVFKIRLVAKEGAEYTGMPASNLGPEYTGPLPEIPKDACPLVQEILKNAQEKIGRAYVWGGESIAEGGFDCSGLIYASYLEAGVPIPRTTFGQWPFGVRVAPGQEKPGDLVFFNSGPGTGTNSPGHVGLVLDADRDLMIEARCTACGPIRVSSYQRSSMTGFTRPLARFNRDCKEN